MRFAVEVEADSLQKIYALNALMIDVTRTSLAEVGPGSFRISALVSGEQINLLHQNGYLVNSVVDLEPLYRRQREMLSSRTTFDDRDALDRANPVVDEGYFSVEQIDAYIQTKAREYPELVTAIELPNWTEGKEKKRRCYAARLCQGSSTNKAGLLFLGGVHAREWLTADVCVNLLFFLATWSRRSDDLVLGGKRFTNAWMKAIVQRLDIVIFPLVNPDGRAYSFSVGDADTGPAGWRKNRRYVGNVDNQEVYGVDINRNYDFLFQYKGSPADDFNISEQRKAENYKGPNPFSESETKNVKSLLDRFPNIRFFVDVHSKGGGGQILYSWGDSANQSTDKNMNFFTKTFGNKNYEEMRKHKNSGYAEYIAKPDEDFVKQLAGNMSAAVRQVRQNYFEPKQSVGLYATAAASDDYCYSRQFRTDGRYSKIFSFTLETGGMNNSWGGNFAPHTRDELAASVRDGVAALLELCCAAVNNTGPVRSSEDVVPES